MRVAYRLMLQRRTACLLPCTADVAFERALMTEETAERGRERQGEGKGVGEGEGEGEGERRVRLVVQPLFAMGAYATTESTAGGMCVPLTSIHTMTCHPTFACAARAARRVRICVHQGRGRSASQASSSSLSRMPLQTATPSLSAVTPVTSAR